MRHKFAVLLAAARTRTNTAYAGLGLNQKKETIKMISTTTCEPRAAARRLACEESEESYVSST
jgi:hypothetical protein